MLSMLRISSLIFFTLVTAYSFSQTTTQSKRVTKPVFVDGKTQEWITPFGLYESKTQLMFSITNNDSTLYLCFQCPDPVNQDKIMQAGMQVSITGKGKNKLNASIEFPLKKTGKNGKAEQPVIENQLDLAGIKASFILNNYEMLTDGFTIQNGIFPIREKKGILIAMDWDSINTLNYEIAIPFRELFGASFTVADLTRELTLKVEIFAVAPPAEMENFNLNGLNTNNGASVVNGGGMQTYGGMGNGTGGGIQNNSYGNGMNNMGMNGYPNNTMTGMSGMQGNSANWDGSSAPQYRDLSGMFEKTEMKQKFLLAVTP